MADSQPNSANESKMFWRAATCSLVGLYLFAGVWGALQVAFPDSAAIHVLSGIGLAMLASAWVFFDAFARGIRILPVLQMLYFLLWPVGAFVYLIYRSGWRGMLLGGIHATGIAAVMMIGFNGAIYALHARGLLDDRFY